MKKIENYRPAFIEFSTESADVPKYLNDGEPFESADAAHKFINENLVASSTKFTAEREMDQYEIDQLREQYQTELEAVLPELEEEEEFARIAYEQAKEKHKRAKEQVQASNVKVKQLAAEVREGVTDMNLDQAFTYEVVYSGRRFYYTIIDKKIQLCGVREIGTFEQEDLLSSSKRNGQYFEQLKEVVNG